MHNKPIEKIKKSLSKKIPAEIIKEIPRNWEKIGNVLILKIPDVDKKYQKEIGREYSKVLNCKTVLKKIGAINGLFRIPKVEIIYGSENTETIHIENGIRYKFDPVKIMFSSGNMNERIRMANISNNKEIVVDFFAGIGYFSLPIAIYSKPKKVYACEINPLSFNYLCSNILLNDVSNIIEPILGDNRQISPKNLANRILLGNFGETYKYLPAVFECLKNSKGIIHYHDVLSDVIVPEYPLKDIQRVSEKFDRKINLINYKTVKSFAPGISHYVFDIEIDVL